MNDSPPASGGSPARPYDFAAAFEHAALGLVIADTQGRILHANAAYEALVGRPLSELVGRDSRGFTHPDDLEQTKAQVARTRGTSRTFEKRYIRPDGSLVWARIHLSAAHDDTNGDYLIGTAEDISEQKAIREELIDTRRRVSSALIAGEVATYEWDVTSDRLWGDANFDRIFGTERDADGTAPLARFVEAIHPDDRERVMAAVQQTVDTGAEYDTEYRVLNVGVERTVSARGRLAKSEATGQTLFHGVVLDITARKRAEHELQRRSRLYDTFLSGTDDLAYLIDREGRFTFANRALLELWGMTLEEVTGKNLYDLGYPKWHADMNMREFAQLIETKKTITGEVPYVSPTGVAGLYEYVFSPVLDENGEVEVIAGTSRDVADRRKSAELQQRLLDQLRLALEAAHMGWWQIDLETGNVAWDERTRAMFDATEEQIALADVLQHLVEEDVPVIRDAMAAATDPHDPRPYDVQFRVRMRDGSIRWIVSKGLPIFTGDGAERRAVSFVGTALDITSQKVAEHAVQTLLDSERAARSEAERASRMKDEFLATLSHELRTPLAAILGWAQILAGGGNSAEEVREGIHVIARNARAQAQIIEDLLEMSRIISGKIRLDVREVEVEHVIRSAMATVQNAADAKGVQLSLLSDDHSASIQGDENRLQQVFWNLLSNAVKFTPRDGSVVVHVASNGSEIEVSVIDSGEGIASEFLPFVFDRFRQADATTTRHHGGLGLGLAIVKQLVELHGGSVRVASPGPGRGATFTVTLPCVPVVATAIELQPRPHAQTEPRVTAVFRDRIEGLRILVVDDDDDARSIVRRFLEDRSASVTAVASALDAMVQLRSGDFDVVVSDIGMPGEDGYSLVQKIRAAGFTLPTLALTAYARPDERARAMAAGFDAHMAKPATAEDLVSLVAGLAGRV